jgi:2-polyprenyl-6-methoxyphenol hydroxylase-like FAD-dependent oxidoreductase
VAIVGAGLGGLCLAQGLRRSGVDAVVYERDPRLAGRRQGYRIHLDARGVLALRECLPAGLFELFLATCGRPGTQVTVLSSRLRVLREIAGGPGGDPDDPATLSTSVNRLTLREVLWSGLGDRVSFGHELSRYTDDGTGITLHFADGTTAVADVLVGADGVNSAVRRQLLPDAEVRDTGGRCVYGKTPLDEATLALVPAALHRGFTAIVGGHLGMATGLVQLRNRPDEASAHLSPAGDYLMWALSGQHDRFPVPDARLSALDPAGLHGIARDAVRSWHPDLRALIDMADVDETFLVRVRTSVPVPAWTPGVVTVLGDAIHAMSPAGGSGANTALRDAALLSGQLTGVLATDRSALVAAIDGYEAEMRAYGYAAVLESQNAERRNTSTGLGRMLLRLADRLHARNG